MAECKRSFLSEEWIDGDDAIGGIYYRAFDLIQFMKKVEETKGRVLGITFDDSWNIELIFKPKTDEGESKQ